MEYHLSAEGRNLGVFQLDELRRRRLAGQLTGREYVWRAGMAEWQPLDAVLQAGETPLVSPSGVTPAGASRKRKGLRFVLWGGLACLCLLLSGGITLGLLARKTTVGIPSGGEPGAQEVDPVKVASLPVMTGSNTLTEAKMRGAAKEFRVRQWLQGYEQRGRRDHPLDAEALRFLKTWIGRNYGEPAPELPSNQQWADQMVAAPACKDGLLLTVAAINTPELNEKIRRLERALEAFPSSKHRGYPQWYATVMLSADLNDKPARVAVLDPAAVQLFQQTLTDGSLLPEDEEEVARILLEGWGSAFFKRQFDALCPVVNAAGKPYEWLSLILAGEREMDLAWKARGGGYADTVSEKGWEGFSTHLAASRRAFTRAWQLHPERVEGASRMIRVAMGDSDLAEMRTWFDRATLAQVDDVAAWRHLRWGVLPRYYGTTEAMLALGKTALATKRFDTDVPRMYLDVVSDLAAEEKVRHGEYIYGRAEIWPGVQRVYEGYLEAPTNKSQLQAWRSAYIAAAFLGGKYDIARAQLEALDWAPRPENLRNWGRDLTLLPLEVAARTGPASKQVADAEYHRQAFRIQPALEAYRAIQEAVGQEERTKRFAQARVGALEMERRWITGEWVDLLPQSDEDASWEFALGNHRRLPDGALEVESGPEGHLLYARGRIGPRFEVVRSSTEDFQAGLVMGLPDPTHTEWYGFRIKRSASEGTHASFARGWTRRQLVQPMGLKTNVNQFTFRFDGTVASASVNDREIFRQVKPPLKIQVPTSEWTLGLGAFNEMNHTVIRYRNVQARRLSP